MRIPRPVWAGLRRRAPSGAASGYDAFISYSHALDGRLAPALQRAVSRVAKPFYKARALHVFRDRTDLSASPELWPMLEAALTRSRFLILLASPQAARSKWIDRELACFLAGSGPKQILIAITDGHLFWNDAIGQFDAERSSACPPSLLTVFPSEPNWVDLRWVRDVDQLSIDDPRFKDAALDLAAPIRGRTKDELAGDDVRHRRRRSAIVWTLLALFAALSGIAIAQSWRAQTNLASAEARLRDLTLESARQALLSGNPDGALERLAEALPLGAGGEITAILSAQAASLSAASMTGRAEDDPSTHLSAAWSDGSECLLVTSSWDGDARLYKAANGKLAFVHSFQIPHGSSLPRVHALSDDCKSGVVSGGEATVAILDLADGTVEEYQFDTMKPRDAFVSPDGSWVILTSETRSYGFRARDDGGKFELPAARMVLWRRDGHFILVPDRGSPTLSRPRLSQPVRTFHPARDVMGAAVSRDWTTLLTWSQNRAWVFDVESGREVASANMAIKAAAVSPTAAAFAIVQQDTAGLFTLIDGDGRACDRDRKEACTLALAHTFSATGGGAIPSFSAAGDKLLMAGRPAMVFGPDSGQPLLSVGVSNTPYEPKVFAFDPTGARFVLVVPLHVGSGSDELLVEQLGPSLMAVQTPATAATYGARGTVIVCRDEALELLHEETLRPVQRIAEPCRDVASSAEHTAFAVVHDEWSFDLWDGTTLKRLARAEISDAAREKGRIVEIHVNNRGRDVLVLQDQGRLTLWRREGEKLKLLWEASHPRGSDDGGVAFSNDDRAILQVRGTSTLGTGQEHRWIDRLDAETGAEIKTTGPESDGQSGGEGVFMFSGWSIGHEISHQGFIIDNNGSDAIVTDATTNTVLGQLSGLRGSQWSVARSPDGSVLVTGGAERMATLWRASDGARLGTLEGHGGSVSFIQYRPTGRGLMTIDETGMLRLWRFDASGPRR